MNRILLADDSPHAQRMGERILRDEGYEVVSVTDGETALLRMADVDPDLIVCDVFLPERSGLDICRYVKNHAKHRHVRVVLTAGMLEHFDEQEARTAGADAILKKPFEASVVLETIAPLIAQSRQARTAVPGAVAEPPAEPANEQAKVVPSTPVPAPSPAPPAAEPLAGSVTAGTGVSEEELLRAAITVALDAAFPALVEDVTAKVLRSLRSVGNGSPHDYEPPEDVSIPMAVSTTESA